MSNILYENGSPVYAIVNGKMVEVQEVRHGRWEDLHCTVCGKIGWSDEDDYCPNCGASMRGEDDE